MTSSPCAAGWTGHDVFRMVATSVLPQVCHWDQNTTTDPSCWETFRGHQVVKTTLTYRQKLSSLFTTHQQPVFRRDTDSLGRLPAITPEFSSYSLPLWLYSVSVEVNDSLCRHNPIPCPKIVVLVQNCLPSHRSPSKNAFISGSNAFTDSIRTPHSTPLHASASRPSVEVKQ